MTREKLVIGLIILLLNTSCTKEEDFNFIFSVYNNESCQVDLYIRASNESQFKQLSTLQGNETYSTGHLKTYQNYKARLVKEGLSQANYFFEFDVYSKGEKHDYNVIPYE